MLQRSVGRRADCLPAGPAMGWEPPAAGLKDGNAGNVPDLSDGKQGQLINYPRLAVCNLTLAC
jgi:hypothetical protein